MREIKYIILHHSATDYRASADDTPGKRIGKTICEHSKEQWQAQFPGYKCDYHFIIGHTGEVFKAQPIEQPSWHCTNYKVNLISVGICFLGNFNTDKMPVAQLNAGVKLIKTLQETFNTTPLNILRHKDIVSDITGRINSTECPGKNFPYTEIIKAITTEAPFADVGNAYLYLYELQILKDLGIIQGDTNGNFNPGEYITREEAMLIAYRILQQIKK